MLYDTRWDKTKTDPFSLESLIAWLEKQPADKSYRYGCNGSCLLAQYFTAMGFSKIAMGGYTFDHSGGENTRLPHGFNEIAIDFDDETPRERRFTFGAALERAKAAL